MNKNIDIFGQIVDFVRDQGLYPKINESQTSGTRAKVKIKGHDYLIFGSSNYLDISDHALIKKAIVSSLKKYGLSSGATRVLGGTYEVHKMLEKKIANFLDAEEAIIFSAGYLANLGTIPAIVNPMNIPGISMMKPKKKQEMTVFSDEGNHGSIHDAIKLATCEKVIFRHNNMEDLKSKINRIKRGRKLIITQGVFTTDGSIAPLPSLIKIKKKYNAILMIDDADGIGVLGKYGRGTSEYYNLPTSDVDILMGSFTKAFGGFGGFVVGSSKLINYIRIAAKTNLLSAPLPPIISAAMIKSIELVYSMGKERKYILNLARYFKREMENMGYNVIGGDTPLVLVMIGDEKKALKLAEDLFRNDITAPVIRWPAVPWGKSRIRFVITTSHNESLVDKVISFFKSRIPIYS